MNTQWLKEATNEELFEQYEISLNQSAKATMFSTTWWQCKEELKLIKEEMLKRMN